ncbi:MAG: hypothetical protein EA365_05400 [Gloeocapsa sp. DLM2.Bin57]|nr:MAG: hypothetical protein EA365_05400 [Gloeocapsa sp. DLM2.Bin57]
MIISITSLFIPPALAKPLSPGNIIITPSICVNTTGGTCRTGTIIVDDGTCKRNVVVQPSSLVVTGNRRSNAQSTQVVTIGDCIPDGINSTATVIVNPQIMVTPTPPTRPIHVNPVIPNFP